MLLTALDEWGSADIELAGDIVERFARTRAAIEKLSILSWGEHCTECAWPTCYWNCSLYTPRRDLKCRRFEHGLERGRAGGFDWPLLRVSFRKWGKLEASGKVTAIGAGRVRRVEALESGFRRLAPGLAALPGLPDKATAGWNKVKTRLAEAGAAPETFDSFLIEAVNAGATAATFTLTIKPQSSSGRYFQRHFELKPGYNRLRVDCAEIRAGVELDGQLLAQIEPVEIGSGNEFIFHILDFVRLSAGAEIAMDAAPRPAAAAKAPQPAAKVKCVVWDLDNTLWRGVLIEDGLENLTLVPGVVEMIKELDQRGVLHSVASKNNTEEALRALEHFGLTEYFLVPQISWEPKSKAIAEIARRLNIHKNTFVFVDDQAFERAEVRHAHPDVRVLDALEFQALLRWPELDLPVTEEGRKRRLMYKVEAVREAAMLSTDAPFLDFLRSCELKLTIEPLSKANIERVFELSQRTNQLNYAGKALPRAAIDDLAAGAEGRRGGYVLSCSDRFGDYGIIGFAVVDEEAFHVENFFMSCRVQHKKVDHAFFHWLLERAGERGRDRVTTVFRISGRNQAAKEVLDAMRFEPLPDAEATYVSPPLPEFPEGEIVTVSAPRAARPVSLAAQAV